MKTVRRLCAIPILLALTGCRSARPPAVVPDAVTPARLAGADRLVRSGCLDCLIAAYGEYDLLRAVPSARDAAAAGMIRAAALIALRQREIGYVDEGYLQRARLLASATAGVAGPVALMLDVIDALPAAGSGSARTPTSDVDLDRMRRLRINQEAWRARLLELAPTDELTAYTYLAFACENTPPQSQTIAQIVAPIGTLGETTLLTFKRGICRRIDVPTLDAVLAKEPKFIEVKYFQGLFDVAEAPRVGLPSKLDEADRRFDEAFAWRKEWPALTLSIGNIAMTAEEYTRAITAFSQTLALEPRAVDALLGKVRALTFMGRADEAIAGADELLKQNWFVGDARYWRAYNLTELERYDEAWAEVEIASKLVVNADVPKLAGLIAYRRAQPEVARERFALSLLRNRNDCETHFYHAIVLAELRSWEPAADGLVKAAACLGALEERYRAEIDTIRGSTDPPARREMKIARREQYIAKGRRQIAMAFYNAAVSSYNLQRKADAREYAAKVAGDEQFGALAKDILARLK
jgi:tetratricopeptide (TPR) repeat protein